MLFLYKINKTHYSILIAGLYVIICIINSHLFMSDSFLTKWYEGIATTAQIQEMLSMVKKLEWSIVLFNILLIFLKIAYVALCLYLGFFFFYNQNNLFNIAFNIALKAEIIFVLCYIVRLLWNGVIRIPESLEEFQVTPFSLMCFFDPSIIEPWLNYSLNTFNLFEVFYIWLLSALMAIAIQVKFRKAFEIVFISYGAGLLLLIVTQMFLILSNT